MDNRNILNLRRDVREMQLQHNRLTALCALLYKNIKNLKGELRTLRSSGVSNANSNQQQSSSQSSQQSYNQMPSQQNYQSSRQSTQSRDIDEIHADEILRQLSAHN